MELPKSVLESEYIQQTRPYSQNELKYLRENLYRNLRLSDKLSRHSIKKSSSDSASLLKITLKLGLFFNKLIRIYFIMSR